MPRRFCPREWLGLLLCACLAQKIQAAVSRPIACPLGCSSHGICVEGLCQCSSGWAGQDCNYFLAASTGPSDAVTEEEGAACLDGCSSHGTCEGGICSCNEGWEGVSCSLARSCPDECRPPSGQCVSGTCHCAAGFFGSSCTDKACSNDCWGHGTCNLGTCQCNEGWLGDFCDRKVEASSMCDPPCANSGRCVDGQCYCSPGFSGIDCSLPAPQPVLKVSDIPNHQIGNSTVVAQQPAQMQPQVASPSKIGGPPQQVISAMEREIRVMEDELRALPRAHTPSRTVVTSPSEGLRPAAAMVNATLGLAPATPSQQKGFEATRQAVRKAALAAERLRHAATEGARRSTPVLRQADSKAKGGPPGRVHDLPADKPVPSMHRQQDHIAAVRSAPALIVASQQEDPDHEDSVEPTLSSSSSQWDLKWQTRAKLEESRRLVAQLRVQSSPKRVPSQPAPATLLSQKSVTSTNQTSTGCEADCNGNGACITYEGSLACRCYQGWVGMLCDMPRCKGDCNGQGICMRGKCFCNQNWYGDGCTHARCPDDCSGTGYCFKGRCYCNSGFGGANCAEVQATGRTLVVRLKNQKPLEAPPSVNRFLATASLRASPKALCPENCNNHGTCSAEGTCMCSTGYSGPACQSSCPNECSHQGTCIEGACLCFSGYMGNDCSIAGCCSGHGSCEDPTTCVCQAGWGGPDCSVRLVCPDASCSGHGNCTDGICKCKPGFSGATCAVPSGICDPPCSPNGMCNPATKRCDCAAGFTGLICSTEVLTCPKHCSGKGLCLDGRCMCGEGWAGEDCGQRSFVPGTRASALLTGNAVIGVGALGASGGGAQVLEPAGMHTAIDESVSGPASTEPALQLLLNGRQRLRTGDAVDGAATLSAPEKVGRGRDCSAASHRRDVRGGLRRGGPLFWSWHMRPGDGKVPMQWQLHGGLL